MKTNRTTSAAKISQLLSREGKRLAEGTDSKIFKALYQELIPTTTTPGVRVEQLNPYEVRITHSPAGGYYTLANQIFVISEAQYFLRVQGYKVSYELFNGSYPTLTVTR